MKKKKKPKKKRGGARLVQSYIDELYDLIDSMSEEELIALYEDLLRYEREEIYRENFRDR